MTDIWDRTLHGRQWRSSRRLWVENGVEYSWEQVDAMATAIEAALGDARVVRIRSDAKLGCFAGQLAAWRYGCVAVADDGRLGPGEIDRVRPDLTVAVHVGELASRPTSRGGELASRPTSRGGELASRPTSRGGRRPQVVQTGRAAATVPSDRRLGDIVAVNFTSGSTGSRKAVAVTRANLAALFACRGLDVPAGGTAVTAGSFATPTFDGWWFDTWRTVSAGGTVVCLPGVNEDVFAWPELAETYGIDRVLLPAAVLATVVEAMPSCLADFSWIFSGGEQFRTSTLRRARDAGLTNRFVNLYGPTEATFATHKYELPTNVVGDRIPIGRPLDGCHQTLDELDPPGRYELVVGGPFVCLGYLDGGVLSHRFEQTYRTRDIVRVTDGELVYAGRLDSQLKVNGMRVDTAALEQRVVELPDVLDCRVVQDGSLTVAFVRADVGRLDAARRRVESVVRTFSPAIGVRLVHSFPTKPGGKVDIHTLINQLAVVWTKDEQT